MVISARRFDRVGIYVVMFLEILQTLIKVLFIFSILIIAFGLAFHILLSRVWKGGFRAAPGDHALRPPPAPSPSHVSPLALQGDHLSFITVPMSLMRIFSMMLGEVDFLGTYVQPYYLAADAEQPSLPLPLTTFLVLGVFMVIMPILLMNLLIGLAVGDIESVRRNAQLKRLAMQVSARASASLVSGILGHPSEK